MLRHRIDAGASVWESDTGWLRIEVPLPYLARVTFRGQFTDDFVEPLSALADRLRLDGRPVIGFQDWEEMTNYQMSARMRLVAIALRNHATTERIHFVAGSTIVRMAIQVANLAMGKVEVHPGRRSFEEAYARAIEGAARKPM
jgi:hypothetical protein